MDQITIADQLRDTWDLENWNAFRESVSPEKNQRVVIYKFTVPPGDHDLRLYTANQRFFQCCIYLSVVYPAHNHYFFSTLPMFRYGSDFSTYWNKQTTKIPLRGTECKEICNFKHVVSSQGGLRGFSPKGPCVLIVDDYKSKEVQMDLAACMMFKTNVILVILSFDDSVN